MIYLALDSTLYVYECYCEKNSLRCHHWRQYLSPSAVIVINKWRGKKWFWFLFFLFELSFFAFFKKFLTIVLLFIDNCMDIGCVCIYIYIYIYISSTNSFIVFTTQQCGYTCKMLQTGIKTRLTLHPSDILPHSNLSVSEGILTRMYYFS